MSPTCRLFSSLASTASILLFVLMTLSQWTMTALAFQAAVGDLGPFSRNRGTERNPRFSRFLRLYSTSTTPPSQLPSSPSILPETFPLPPHTFAGMVEQGMVERFGSDNIQRVLTSWRLLDRDYEHREYVGSNKDKDSSTSMSHQHCHSYVPGLTAKEFWDTSEFDWCDKLASKYPAIRREFDKVTSDMALLQQQGNNVWAGALTNDAASYGEGWKTLVLMDRGQWDATNVNLFPVTAKAVVDSGVPSVEVFFTSLQPHTSIKPHSDFTNFVLTSHLGLDIPYSGTNQCRLTIGDETREWINGQVLLFDTSILHDAFNDSDKVRYILMLRLWHPDLTETERAALQFTYDSLEFPALVTTSDTSPEARFAVERQVEARRAFPEIKKGSAKIQGFGGGGGGSGGSSGGESKKKKKKGRR